MGRAIVNSKEQSTRANSFHLLKQSGSRYFSMRVMHLGSRRRFTTGESALKQAQAKARAIMADIQSKGFEEAVRLHARRRDETPSDPTLNEFGDLYRKVASGFDQRPGNTTAERYIRCLVRIGESVGARRVSAITPEKIETFKESYLRQAREKGRSETSMRTTLNGVLRNAAALFSAQALQSYRRLGMNLESPFKGSQIRGVRIASYSPLPRDMIQQIWTRSQLLRDGDPSALPVDESLPPREQIDFSEPHWDAYVLLLLELGLGLRRNEADKAEWSWFNSDSKGRQFIEVRATDYFLPKSKQSRIVPVEEALWVALKAAKTDERFVVQGGIPRTRESCNETKSAVYRCDRGHRVLVQWLREQGVDDPKPCHRLRKEFGSYVSTTFGLFHAQRFLGHSSPNVTAAYYAGLTDMPVISPSLMGQTHERH